MTFYIFVKRKYKGTVEKWCESMVLGTVSVVLCGGL